MRAYLEFTPVKLFCKALSKLGLPAMEFYYDTCHKEKRRMISLLIPDSLDNLATDEDCNTEYVDKDVPIFFMWWQGPCELPPIVKLCYAQLRKNAGAHPIVFVSHDNYKDVCTKYGIPLEDKVISWVETNKITIQYLSDIIRTNLLCNGGVWVDSTVFIARPIDDILLNSEFYSGKREWHRGVNPFPAEGRWTSYFISSGKNNRIIKFINSGLKECIDNYGEIPDYFTVDYLFSIAYERSMKIKSFIDSLPTVEPVLSDFNDVDKPLSLDEFRRIYESAPFFKLNWRNKGVKITERGENTIFGYLTKVNEDGYKLELD